jgi:hypothetical protein
MQRHKQAAAAAAANLACRVTVKDAAISERLAEAFRLC